MSAMHRFWYEKIRLSVRNLTPSRASKAKPHPTERRFIELGALRALTELAPPWPA